MRKLHFAAVLAIVVLTVGCAVTKPADSADGSVKISGQKWQLIELNGAAVAGTINGKVPFIEFHDTEGRFSASGGCNGLGGEYTLLKGNGIKFSRGMSTMMACQDMTVEQGLSRMFEQVDNYTISGNTLSFSKAKMAPVAKFKLIEDQTAQLAGTWELDYISGPRIAFAGLFPDKKPTLVFDIVNKKVSGNGGCNNFNGGVTFNGSSIKFGPAMSTKMACPGEGEPLFFKTLDQVSSFSVTGNTLNLIMGDIAVMRFQKK